MRLEDWHKWLDSQFVEEEEKAKEPSRAAQETLLFDVTEEPAKSDMEMTAQAAIEQPSAPPDNARPPEAAVPLMSEPTSPTAPAPVTETPRHESQEISDSRSDMPEEIEVPSIERYLPFLFGRQPEETPSEASGEITEETEETPTPEFVTPAVSEASSEEPQPVQEPIQVEIVAEEPQPQETPAEEAPEPIRAVEEPVSDASEPVIAVSVEWKPVETVEKPPPAPAQTRPAAPESGKKPAPKPENRRYGISRRRSRHARNVKPAEVVEEISAESLWGLVPRHIQTLIAIGAQTEVAQNSYKRQFKETRLDMIQRLLDPTLSLADTARLLNVCPTTVRRYTNKGLLTHQRQGRDRRSFKLSDVLAFLEAQSQARSKQP
jgi:hypothetical protein